jgi:hypothetical protein
MFAIAQNLTAINKDMLHAASKQVRLFECFEVGHGLRVEYDNICVIAR